MGKPIRLDINGVNRPAYCLDVTLLSNASGCPIAREPQMNSHDAFTVTRYIIIEDIAAR